MSKEISELELKFKELEIILNEKIKKAKEKLKEEIIAGEIIDKNGFIYSFLKTNDGKFILKEPSFFNELNLNDIVDIKTIPESQRYNGKLTTDIIVHYKETENSERKYLFVQRMFPPSGLALPGGQIENFETSLINALKEIEEETGLKIKMENLLHLGTFKGKEIRGTMKTEVYSVDLNKVFSEGFQKVLSLLAPGSDAIGLISKKLGEVLGIKCEKPSLDSLVPHHKEILQQGDKLLTLIDNNKKVNPNDFSTLSIDKKELSSIGVKFITPESELKKDPEKEKKKN